LYGTDRRAGPTTTRASSARKAVDRFVSLIDQSKVWPEVLPTRRALPRSHDLVSVTWDDPIMEDEIFGPILPILTYKDMDAAIREGEEASKTPFRFPFQP